MKTRRSFRPVLLAAALLIFINSEAQVSVDDNIPTNPGQDYVGWDNNTTVPLEIRHDAGDQPIEFYTTGDGISEMWLTPTLQNFVFNTYTTLDLSGNLGVGNNFSMNNPPLSRIHIKDQGNISDYTPGYRDWMRSGVLSTTSGRDGMYVGLRELGGGNNPAIINWSSNILAQNDPLRFIFSSSFNSAGAQGTQDGLEIARMVSDNNGNEGYFGLGDYNVAGFEPGRGGLSCVCWRAMALPPTKKPRWPGGAISPRSSGSVVRGYAN